MPAYFLASAASIFFPSHLKGSVDFSCMCYIYILSFQFVTNMNTRSYTVYFFMSYIEIKMFRMSDRAVKLKKSKNCLQYAHSHFFSSAIQTWNLNESSTLLERAIVIKQISKYLERKTNILGKNVTTNKGFGLF